MRPDWDEYFAGIATAVSLRADCTRRQVGCVIVDDDHRILATGYNGAPPGRPGCASSGACPRGKASYEQVAASSDYTSGAGLCIAVHAETNALLFARASVKGATAFITDKPCPTCFNNLLAAGIRRIVSEPDFEYAKYRDGASLKGGYEGVTLGWTSR